MSIASKLFQVWMLKKTVSSTTPLFMRLLLGMVALTIIAVVGAILGALIIVGMLWMVYEQFLVYGIPPHNAQLIIGGVMLAFLAFAIHSMQRRWRMMRKIANSIIYLQSPLSGRLHSVTDAFMAGYHKKRPAPKRS